MEKKMIKKSNAGRPLLKLDEKQIIELARIHCTMIEIAAVMGCSVRTLERNYADIIKTAKESGKTSLRRYMWKACEKGNTTMMIWLSKNLLGMHEPQVIEVIREEAKSPFNAWYDEQAKGKAK